MSTNAYKIVLCGGPRVGKTTFITRLVTGEYIRRYVQTLYAEVHQLVFHTSAGMITFNVWDTEGNYFGSDPRRENYFNGADGAIVMCAGEEPHRAAKEWEEIAKKYTDQVVLVSNQCDRVERVVPAGFVPVSARTNCNIEEPFLRLARRLTNHPDLEFVNPPAVEAPLVGLN